MLHALVQHHSCVLRHCAHAEVLASARSDFFVGVGFGWLCRCARDASGELC